VTQQIVKFVTEAIMSKVIIKVGGVASILAGLLIVANEIRDLVTRNVSEDLIGSAVLTAWSLLMLFGVLGGYLRQQRAFGAFGQIATLVVVFGTVTIFAGSMVQLTVLPALPADSPLINEAPPGLQVLGMVGLATFVVGVLLLATATWRARVLPRTAPVVLLGGMVLALALMPIVPGANVAFGVGWIWFGAATLDIGRARRIGTTTAELARA
jgi:hypothetical protein